VTERPPNTEPLRVPVVDSHCHLDIADPPDDWLSVEDARRMATLLAGTAVSFFKIGLARDRPRRRPRAGVC